VFFALWGGPVRRLSFAVVLLLLFVPAARVSAATWQRPVPGPVARPFDPPKQMYGPGHLGVDFSAAPGTFVRAAGPGTVVFAGTVAFTRHVVIRHAGNLRTSYSFLATIRVRRGDPVQAGDVVGTTGGRGEQHDGTVLHFGLRIGDTYVDPMQLFAGLDLAAHVHLAPLDHDPRDEAASLADGIPAPDYPVLCATEWCNSGRSSGPNRR
jgi:murein DD-endopeptidase MepM/ murein hydrolase activator NlpD